jgi:hypothetical protein
LIYSSAEYDKQGLAAYKSFDDYRLFDEGYIESLLTTTLTDKGMHLYVGKARPAMKMLVFSFIFSRSFVRQICVLASVLYHMVWFEMSPVSPTDMDLMLHFNHDY